MIPNRFHFVFGLKRQFQPFHLIHYLCLASCLEVNHPAAVYFYYHHEPHGRYWDLIRERIIPVRIPGVSFIDRYKYLDWHVARYKYAHASDFVRLQELLALGGIYADMDTLFVNPIPGGLRTKTFVLGCEDLIPDPITGEPRSSLCNAFIMAEREAAFGRLWLDQLESTFDGTWSNHSTLLPHHLAMQHPDLIHIEPSRTFYKHMWTPEGLYTLLQGLDRDNEGVVSFHLWGHLWWSRLRRDFSTFHASKMTETYIRNVDTTYSVVARKYLPPPETRSFVVRQANALAHRARPFQAVAREAAMKIYILAKLATFSVIKENLVPRAAEHLDYARRQWKHPEVRTRFQARNLFEKQGIFADVALWDCYGVEDLEFAPDDVILDIGAHVGMLSYQCYQRGSRAIYAFEPELGNFRQLARHLGGLEGLHLRNLAVFRSDVKIPQLIHSGYPGENTGGGNVLAGGATLEINEQAFAPAPEVPQVVEVIALDEILECFERVALLKLDCEGSEFPILLTSRLLRRIEHIVGEYHEILPETYQSLEPQAQLDGYSAYKAYDLVTCLEASGFDVSLKNSGPNIGSFDARRRSSL